MNAQDKNQQIIEGVDALGIAVKKMKSIIDTDYVRGPYVLAFRVIEAKYRSILQEMHQCDKNNRNYPEPLRRETVQCMHTIQNLREEIGIVEREAYT